MKVKLEQRRSTLLFALLLWAFVALACANSARPQKVGNSAAGQPAQQTTNDRQGVSEAQAEASEQQQFAVGDLIQLGNLVMTVNEVSSPPGTDFFKPDAGKKFVVVDVTFENKSAKEASISTLLQMELKDEDGQKYTMDLSATSAVDGSTPDGSIAPGEKLRGKVGFQVPVDARGLVFVYDPIVGGQRVRVKLPQEF